MNMAERIQALRKKQGVSQEELAAQVNVSRQAVSKWESGQSIPDLENILMLSDYFQVTTDYILKGVEPAANGGGKDNRLAGRVLYPASTALMAIGLLCAFAGWYEEQTLSVVWGAMIIQVVGLAGYFLGRVISGEAAPWIVRWLNLIIGLFMPVSMVTGLISIAAFRHGWLAPYPAGREHIAVFALGYLAVCALGLLFFKTERKQSSNGTVGEHQEKNQ